LLGSCEEFEVFRGEWRIGWGKNYLEIGFGLVGLETCLGGFSLLLDYSK